MLYLGGDAYTAPAVYMKQNGGSWQLYYLIRDHQGSIAGILDNSGNRIATYSYDPWGRMRDPNTLVCYAVDSEPALLFNRGYSGHEHLAMFGLINMNGRLYDPVLGRFLNVDNFVQDATNSQSFNRYAYCLNNPLVYSDPDGEFPFLIIGLMLLGGYLGGVGTNQGELNPAKWDYKSPSTYIGIGFGMLMGCLGGYGLNNPGTFKLSVGITTPVAGFYLVGNGSNWQFQWTTSAGGSGEIPINKPNTVSVISSFTNNPSGSYYDKYCYDDFSSGAWCPGIGLGYGYTQGIQSRYPSTYAGDFYGAPVYENDFFKFGAAVTLPPRGIFVGIGVYNSGLSYYKWQNNKYLKEYNFNNLMTLRHEFGHWLTWKEKGTLYYYSVIAPQSLNAAIRAKLMNHPIKVYMEFWTERLANTYSYRFFNGLNWDRDYGHD